MVINRHKKTPESKEYDSLKSIDLEFESPQDEYSYQPDSGSLPNGDLAKDEGGVDIVEDAKTLHNKFKNNREIDNIETQIPG